MKEIDLFQCKDLTDFYQRIKALKAFKSIRQLSRRLGYRSDRNLGMAFRGDRPLSSDIQTRLAKWLKLTPHEIHYLSLLAQQDRALRSGEKESETLQKQIQEARPTVLSPIPLSDEELKELARWYYHVVIDVVEALGKKASFERILKAFKGNVSSSELRHCLSDQVKLGRLAQAKGFYSRTKQGTYWAGGEVPSAFLRESHRQFLAQAEKAIEGQKVDRRHLISVTFALEKDKISYAKKRVTEVMRDLLAEFESVGINQQKIIYQANLQLFEVADPTS